MNDLKYPKSDLGFTLIELIVALAILGIILSVGVPSFQQAVLNAQINNARSALLADLNLARVEAVKGRTRVMVCARESDTTCGSDWTKGWIVYEDSAPSGTAFDLDSRERVVRVQNQSIVADNNIEVSSTIRSNVSSSMTLPSQYAFESRGRSGVSGLIVLCDSRGGDEARTIVITAGGAIRTSMSLNAAGDKVDPWGDALQCPQ